MSCQHDDIGCATDEGNFWGQIWDPQIKGRGLFTSDRPHNVMGSEAKGGEWRKEGRSEGIWKWHCTANFPHAKLGRENRNAVVVWPDDYISSCKFRNDDNRGGGPSEFFQLFAVVSSLSSRPSIRLLVGSFVPFRLSFRISCASPPYNCHIWTRRAASAAESDILGAHNIQMEPLGLLWDNYAVRSIKHIFNLWTFFKDCINCGRIH